MIVNMPPHAPFAEDYEVWGPANLIYRPESNQVLVAGGTFSKETIHKLMYGSKFGRTMRNITYTGDMQNAVVVSYPASSCVHVMDPEMPLYSLNDDLPVWLAASRFQPFCDTPWHNHHLSPGRYFWQGTSARLVLLLSKNRNGCAI